MIVLLLLLLLAVPAQAFDGENVYGPGIHQDAYGRPFQFEAEDGQTVYGRVKPNAYGPGMHQDEYGRVVRRRQDGEFGGLQPFNDP